MAGEDGFAAGAVAGEDGFAAGADGRVDAWAGALPVAAATAFSVLSFDTMLFAQLKKSSPAFLAFRHASASLSPSMLASALIESASRSTCFAQSAQGNSAAPPSLNVLKSS